MTPAAICIDKVGINYVLVIRLIGVDEPLRINIGETDAQDTNEAIQLSQETLHEIK